MHNDKTPLKLIETKTKKLALQTFFDAMKTLREEGILINKKDFTCQIGEWLIEMIYNGKRSLNGIEKGWDVKSNNEFIQVKTHSKREGNKNRWTKVDKEFDIKIDTLIIIVFSHDYKLKEFYRIPWSEAVKNIKLRGIKSPRNELNWSQVKQYKIEIFDLPHQEIIELFL